MLFSRLHSSMACVAVALMLSACAESAAPGEEPAPSLARPSESDVQARVAEAEARLEATEAGQVVWDAIEGHGGLERSYANGPLRFRYTYERLDGRLPLDTEQIVDPWSSRARHAVMPDSSVQFGWTGETAWAMPDTAAMPTNARFWALTPYYFVAMPFVLADPGVNLEEAGQMEAEGQTYDLVHVTFDAGTGDAPDDYYYLMLDPETRQVGGVRYAVSYPGFVPEGEHAPERIMFYDGAQTADGITLQEGFRSFMWTGDGPGEAAAEGTVTNVAFLPETPDSLFAMPDGAMVQENL